MVKTDADTEDRRQRWLHPKHLPYLWVLIISLVFMPAVAVAVVALFIAIRLGRWLQLSKNR